MSSSGSASNSSTSRGSSSSSASNSSTSRGRSNILDASASWEDLEEAYSKRAERKEHVFPVSANRSIERRVLRSHGKGNKGKGSDMTTQQQAVSRRSAGRTQDSKAVEDKVRLFRQRMQTQKNGSDFKGGREWSPLVSRENPEGLNK